MVLQKKRGCLIVILMLVLTIFISYSGFGDAAQNLKDTASYYTAFICSSDQENWGMVGEGCDIENDNGPITWLKPTEPFTNDVSNDKCLSAEDAGYCHDFAAPGDVVPNKGCLFAMAETNGNDRCAWAYIKEGTIINSQITENTGFSFGPNMYLKPTPSDSSIKDRLNILAADTTRKYAVMGGLYVEGASQSDAGYFILDSGRERYYVDDSDARCAIEFHLFENNPEAKICDSEHYWRGCKFDSNPNDDTDDGTLGATIHANNLLYECVNDDNIPTWSEVGQDKDNDNYVWINDGDDLPPNTARDCDDNPSNDPSFCSDLTNTENLHACSDDVKYAKCAQCINPGMPEICGDGINNDCRGGIFSLEETPFEFGEKTNLEGRTPDTCNNFKEGCEQLPGKGLSQDGTIIDILKYNNNYDMDGEKFSWIQTGDNTGYCCGYNGLNDLGEIKTNSADSTEYLCLNKDENKNLVGLEPADGSTVTATIESYSGDLCGDNWCLLPASGSAKFKILTIKPLGEPAYDVVSDSKKWEKCDGTDCL